MASIVPCIQVSIAAHYVPKRVPFLVEVLKAIEGWEFEQVGVTIVTNDLALVDEATLVEAIQMLRRRGVKVDLDRTHGLEHPFHLTWWHKKHLRRWADDGGSPDDLFIYLEDDIVIENKNLSYFRENLGSLKRLGLIPGFLRFEERAGKRISVDFRGPQLVHEAHRVKANGRDWVNPRFPYWAGFVLDRELAAEYLSSRSANMDEGESILPRHTCRVHSAMALCYENVPPGFTSRYVVPVTNFVPSLDCQLWHSAQNYTRNRDHGFGTVPIGRVFQKPTLKGMSLLHLWRAKAFIRRIYDKLRKRIVS
jgi:hypothetical protein